MGLTDDKTYAGYELRTQSRQRQLHTATMEFVAYFMSLGDDQATAEDKVGQLSDEVAATLYAYVLGRTQPLIDGVNASALPFMDAAAKAKLTGDLTI
jgi:hypothetical protein